MGAGASAYNQECDAKDLPDKVDLATFKRVAGISFSQQVFDAFKDGDECITKQRVIGLGQMAEKMKSIREKFDEIAEGNVAITAAQLLQLMEYYKVLPKEEDKVELDRMLLFPEVLTLMLHRVQDSEVEQEILEAFQMFDLDGDGFITVEELKSGMEQLGESITLEEAREMIQAADDNNDGRIDFNEYARKMHTPS